MRIKARLLDIALTTYQNFSSDQDPPENLIPSEPWNVCQKAKTSSFRKQINNTVVILDECSYISATEEILNDNSKSSKLSIPAGKEINHITNSEKRTTSELKLLKNKEIYLQKFKTSRF